MCSPLFCSICVSSVSMIVFFSFPGIQICWTVTPNKDYGDVLIEEQLSVFALILFFVSSILDKKLKKKMNWGVVGIFFHIILVSSIRSFTFHKTLKRSILFQSNIAPSNAYASNSAITTTMDSKQLLVRNVRPLLLRILQQQTPFRSPPLNFGLGNAVVR